MKRIIVVTVASLCIGAAAATGQAPIAVVVPLESSVSDVSLNELRRLFEGRRTSLGGEPGVALFQHRASRELFFNTVMNTSVSRVARAWIGLVFSGDAATPPIDFNRSSRVQQRVSEARVSIGFLPFAEVDTTLVKVLLVDGLAPDDPNYPIR